MRPDLLQVRAPLLNFYVLRDADGLVLLDSGFIGGKILLRMALKQRGWERERIRGIVLTHGHLDHILNTQALAREYDAWIAAPGKDAGHYRGEPEYEGWARITGALETFGRPLLGFEPFAPDRSLGEGDELDLWNGLKAVELPGHTDGHMGFYCEKLKWMFTGDLFASYGKAEVPPAIFNSNPALIPKSVRKALEFDLVGMVPNHGDRAEPGEHLRRLRNLTSV